MAVLRLIIYLGVVLVAIAFLEFLYWLENRNKKDEDRRREALLEAFLELTRRDRRK